MEAMMDSSAVTLVVKTPNRSIDDLQISCALNWTVEKLKRHLSSVYPSKPESNKQRLIYSGQLLLDHQTVKDFLREHQDGKLHTVHLVCPPSNGESSPSTSAEPSPSSSTTTTASLSPPTTQPATNEGLRFRGHNTPTLPMFSPSPPMWSTNGQPHFHNPMFPPPPPPQMAYQLWMQQMQHMQQMYQHQMAVAHRGQQPNHMFMPPNMQMTAIPQWPHPSAFGPMPSVTPPSPQQPTHPQTPIAPPQPAQPGEAANAAPRQPAQPRNQEVRMNAQGGIADDDDEEENLNNDWLDKIYTLCRAAILMSIVWFYSSTGRFLMLIISVFFIYLYQLGFFDWIVQRIQQRQAQQNNPLPPQQGNPQLDDQTDETDTTEQEGDMSSDEGGNDPDENETSENEPPQLQELPPTGPSTLRVVLSFISTFFTSLVPQQNEVLQGN